MSHPHPTAVIDRRPARHAPRGLLALLGALLLALPLLGTPRPARARAAATAVPVVSRPDDDVLILALRLDRALLVDGLTAWATPRGRLVPLGAVCRALDLAITVDLERATAAGFIISERRPFRLDLARGELTVGDATSRPDPALVERHDDDIYVEAGLLATWLPIDFDIDPAAATLTARPREPLPLQLREERRRRLDSAIRDGGETGQGTPLVGVPYRLLAGPAVDLNVAAASRPGPGGRRATQADYSAFLSGDLLFMEAGAFLRGDSRHAVDEGRLSLGRVDPAGRLLGPLHAREFGVGETWHPGLDLISLPVSGPGFRLGNFPLARQARFDRHAFRGDLPPGWEVELYRNDALIAWSDATADGRYDFGDAPVDFGLNAFRLVFYGPQGQRREESHVMNVGDGMTPPGQFRYRVAGQDPRQGDRRGVAELELGLMSNLSASVGVTSLGLADGRHAYGRAGTRAYWKWFYLDAGMAADRRGGRAAQAALSARSGRVALNVAHTRLNDFTSEEFPASAGTLRDRTTAALSAPLRLPLLPTLNFGLEARRDHLAERHVADQFTGRVSARLLGLNLTNQTRWAARRTPGQRADLSAEGFGLASLNRRHFGLRGELDYTLRPTRTLRAFTASAEARLARNTFLALELQRRVSQRVTRPALNLGRDGGAFACGLSAGYSRREGFGANFTFSIGLSRDSHSGKWYSQARSASSTGAASALAFVDANDNGRMDPGEAPVAGAGLSVAQGGEPAETGPDGQAFLRNIPSHEIVQVRLAPGSLSDPLWIPTRTTVRFVPRPGRAAHLEFPVLQSGEVSGTLYRREGKRRRPLPGVELQLTAAGDSVIAARARTAYDGFYDFTGIRPGTYTLQVAPRELARLGLTAPAPRVLTIAPDGTFVDGADIELKAPAKAAEAKAGNAKDLKKKVGKKKGRKAGVPAVKQRPAGARQAPHPALKSHPGANGNPPSRRRAPAPPAARRRP